MHPRLDNLLASLTLNLGEEATAAMEKAAGVVGGATAALLALDEFLDDAHVGRLAEVLGLTHSGAVRVVTQLERAGLATRHAGSDRRRVEVHLTSQGRRRVKAARTEREDVLRQATESLTEAEARALEELLAKLIFARVEQRVEVWDEEEKRPWWCRTCDLGACGRELGLCPAAAAAAVSRDAG